ncbi:MAG TPA: sensor histidine kinase KdpD [Devosia sp.]|nr:sensor histidine kinase KdpD [Devosia sp.]
MPRLTEKERPDPEALLELAARESRGKLTVFLGAAPGVGKTYAMLERARGLMAQGIDVVIGLVETHGRGDTARLAEGIEVLPRQNDGGPYGEFDLDAALVRRPALLIVDELAHTNTPGSRHPKRYQDIAELIGAGIDVWTALNIQHLESLSDLVARIAGGPVRETVPDIVLKTADEVILVDIPPAELIDRLNAGKVYLPDNAKRAIDGFFKPATLTALRELALRRAADRVDDQMVDFLRQSAVEGPWATGERLLVCVGPDEMSEKVVRVATRLASGLNARWLVVSLSRPAAPLPDEADAARLDETLRLAERLGAEARRESAGDFVEAILRLARREHITQIVVGRPRRRRWFGRSLPDALLRQAGEIGVHVVPGESTPAFRRSRHRLSLPEWAMALGLPIVSVGATTLFGLGINALIALQNLSMLYLVAVLLSAVIAGRFSALLAAVLSFFAYNFYFIEPTGELTVAQPQEVLSLVIFIAVALAAGQLAARLREQMELARQQARQSQALLDFSRKLSGAHGRDSVLDAAVGHLHASLARPAVMLTPDENGELTLAAAWPPDQLLDVTDMTAARWAFDKKEPAGFLTGTLPQVRYLFRPVTSAQRLLGVAGLVMGPGDTPLAAEEERTWTALLDQTAIALDRARLNKESAMASVAREGEKVQAALLSSLSHDLRTPLASITGAVTTLRQLGEKMPAASRDDLLLSIEEESGRLNRFVANLFDMTRIEAGMMKARRDPIDVAAIIDASVARVLKVHPDLGIERSIASELPDAQGDAALLEQVLFNLLDNAHKYGGAGQPVTIYAREDEGMVSIAVTDQGKGIPPADLERIFEKFYRRAKGDGRPAGTGLGLSIARGLMTAMGGTITATSPAIRKRGTRFTLRLPLARKSA